MELVHTKELINKVRIASENLKESESSYTLYKTENYECKDTYNAAKISAAATLTGVRDILDGKHDCGYAIVRPPGHHSYNNFLYGFCYFNNVAIAAEVAM